MKSEMHKSWRTMIVMVGLLFLALFVAACDGGGSGGGDGGGNSALTLAPTYTLPGTSDSVRIYDDSSTNTEFSATQISDIEMVLSGIPPSMLNSVNWVVPESSNGIVDRPSTGQGIIAYAAPAAYVGSARQSDFALYLRQAGGDIYAANEQVGTQAEWQQLIAAGGPFAEAGFDFPDQFEFWIENSVQDMLSLVNDALLNNKVTAVQAAFLGMSSFFNTDHTLNVYYTGPDIYTTSYYLGAPMDGNGHYADKNHSDLGRFFNTCLLRFWARLVYSRSIRAGDHFLYEGALLRTR